MKGEVLIEEPRRLWRCNLYYPKIATNAAVSEAYWKLVRPMISRNCFYVNKDPYVSQEDAVITGAFIESDIKQ